MEPFLKSHFLKNILLSCVFQILFIGLLLCQQSKKESCVYYLYETTNIYPDVLSANIFEQEIDEMGWRNLYNRISDTVFVDYYKQALLIQDNKRRWFFNMNVYIMPESCHCFRHYYVNNDQVSYNVISVDTLIKTFVCSKEFRLLNENNKINCFLDSSHYQTQYSLMGDSIFCENGKIELKTMPSSFKSYFIRGENQVFFDQLIPTLVFKEIYSNREKVVWYDEFRLIPIKIETTYPGNSLRIVTKLIQANQF